MMPADRIEPDELVEGFMVGKAYRLAEWAHRKEQRAFAKLCAKLRNRKYFSAWYRELRKDPARLAKLNARLAEYNKTPKRRAQLNAAQAARRAKRRVRRICKRCNVTELQWRQKRFCAACKSLARAERLAHRRRAKSGCTCP